MCYIPRSVCTYQWASYQKCNGLELYPKVIPSLDSCFGPLFFHLMSSLKLFSKFSQTGGSIVWLIDCESVLVMRMLWWECCFTWLQWKARSWPRSSCLEATATRGVSHCGLAIYIKKYLKAKEELWKLKYFTMTNNNVQKNL
jgi:hypothetical protein